MLLRRLWIVLAFLLVPAVASADAHRAGFFVGGSYLKASTLAGFHVMGDIVPCKVPTESKCKYVALVGDFGLYGGSHDEDADFKIKTFMGGVSMKFASSPTSGQVGSVHALFGGAKGSGGDTEFVSTVGGAYEYIFHRAEPKQCGFRFQMDGIIPKEGDKFLRVSAGFIIRFRK
jgi:hypothetical protein